MPANYQDFHYEMTSVSAFFGSIFNNEQKRSFSALVIVVNPF